MKYKEWLMKNEICCMTGSGKFIVKRIPNIGHIPLHPKLCKELDRIGRKKFEKQYNISLKKIFKELLENYKKEVGLLGK